MIYYTITHVLHYPYLVRILIEPGHQTAITFPAMKKEEGLG